MKLVKRIAVILLKAIFDLIGLVIDIAFIYDGVNTAKKVDEFLKGYKNHDIPDRMILINSSWSLRYNDFGVDTLLCSKAKELFNNLLIDRKDYLFNQTSQKLTIHTNSYITGNYSILKN